MLGMSHMDRFSFFFFFGRYEQCCCTEQSSVKIQLFGWTSELSDDWYYTDSMILLTISIRIQMYLSGEIINIHKDVYQ